MPQCFDCVTIPHEQSMAWRQQHTNWLCVAGRYSRYVVQQANQSSQCRVCFAPESICKHPAVCASLVTHTAKLYSSQSTLSSTACSASVDQRVLRAYVLQCPSEIKRAAIKVMPEWAETLEKVTNQLSTCCAGWFTDVAGD